MINSVLIVYHQGQQEKILPVIDKMLGERKIHYSAIERDKVKESDYDKKDLAIVIGGDGTFLRTSHCNKNVMMFGINPNPARKEGFFMQASVNDFPTKLEAILTGNFKIINLLRLEVSVNNKKLEQPVLNEVYVGDDRPYNIFNYILNIGDTREFQRSSGIIAGTPAGSTAWLKSAGGSILKLPENKYQYIVREPYIGRLTKDYRLRKGILNKSQEIEITAKSNGIIVIDSTCSECRVIPEDIVRISAAKDYLKYVSF